MCDDVLVITDLPNSSLWQKEKAEGEQPQGALKLQHQNPYFSRKLKDANTHGEAENTVHAEPQPWDNDPGDCQEVKGDRSPWNLQETHMWPQAGSRNGMAKLPWMAAFVVFGAWAHHGFIQKAEF